MPLLNGCGLRFHSSGQPKQRREISRRGDFSRTHLGKTWPWESANIRAARWANAWEVFRRRHWFASIGRSASKSESDTAPYRPMPGIASIVYVAERDRSVEVRASGSGSPGLQSTYTSAAAQAGRPSEPHKWIRPEESYI